MLLTEVAKEQQNENKEAELKKQEREGRSHQRESSRNRSGKPSSRVSKSLPPVPRQEQNWSPLHSTKEMDLPVFLNRELLLVFMRISLTKMRSDVSRLAPLRETVYNCERKKSGER